MVRGVNARSPLCGCGFTALAKGAGGGELDLHQADAAATSDQSRLITALALDNPMYQRFGHVIGARMGRDQRVIFAVPGMCDLRKNQRCAEGERDCEK